MFISIEFDASELQVTGPSSNNRGPRGGVGHREFSSVNLPGMGNFFTPIGSTTFVDNTLGLVEGFDQATLSTGLFGATVTLGSVRFHVMNGLGGGLTIRT